MPIDGHLLALFAATTFIAAIAPGPDMLFILGCGMRGGPRAGLLATAGVATSEVIHVAVAAAGLTALFVAVPVAFTIVRIAGAAYLIYLGVGIIRRRNNPARDSQSGEKIAAGQAYRRGLLPKLPNPKMGTFSLSIPPQSVAPPLGPLGMPLADLR